MKITCIIKSEYYNLTQDTYWLMHYEATRPIPGVTPNLVITQRQAEDILRDMAPYSERIVIDDLAGRVTRYEMIP